MLLGLDELDVASLEITDARDASFIVIWVSFYSDVNHVSPCTGLDLPSILAESLLCLHEVLLIALVIKLCLQD